MPGASALQVVQCGAQNHSSVGPDGLSSAIDWSAWVNRLTTSKSPPSEIVAPVPPTGIGAVDGGMPPLSDSGDAVGIGVGTGVGAAVGAGAGAAVGSDTAVGCGAAVGCSSGCAAPTSVGAASLEDVGASVGASVGVGVGASSGGDSGVGVTDAISVGSIAGASVGTLSGGVVGTAVGASVADTDSVAVPPLHPLAAMTSAVAIVAARRPATLRPRRVRRKVTETEYDVSSIIGCRPRARRGRQVARSGSHRRRSRVTP